MKQITAMKQYREIRAEYDHESIVVYQAYNNQIADAALSAGRFVTPFSFQRMTWIKPSFLWLMERSGWGTKSNQTRILSVRISRSGWDEALAEGVLTCFEPRVHHTPDNWHNILGEAPVHIQWDPERSIHGKKLEFRAIQVGISRTLIEKYVSSWIIEIRDLTATTAKIRELRRAGEYSRARRLLPPEKAYPVKTEVAHRLGMEH
ncbi:MAG: DUF4291 domain-containing protein [Planctomycetaceae bacterium]|nr:DUF4291 domain-containing protein [Planctomycetaceae bacterium]